MRLIWNNIAGQPRDPDRQQVLDPAQAKWLRLIVKLDVQRLRPRQIAETLAVRGRWVSHDTVRATLRRLRDERQ